MPDMGGSKEDLLRYRMQALDMIYQMPDEKLSILVQYIQKIIQLQNDANYSISGKKLSKRIGIAEGECLCDPEFDFDKYNDGIIESCKMDEQRSIARHAD